MIGYITLGTRDIQTAAAWYDALFGSIGVGRLFEGERFIAWGKDMKQPGFGICLPHDGNEASVGNGVMIAIAMGKPEQVDAFHARALELGGSDEGAPGPRGDQFYAGYFRDLDGNKLNAFCMVG